MEECQARPTIVQPGAGKLLADRESVVMLGGEQTAGQLAVLLGNVPPGGGPPYHVHARDDELFLVLDGTLSFFAGGAWTDVGPGGVAYFSKGVAHRFRNNGAKSARRWVLTTPAGFEQFLAQSTEEVARPGGPDRARMVALEAEYGYTLLAEPTGIEEDTESKSRATVVQPGAGKVLDFGPGREVSVLLDGAQTGGQLTMINELMPPDFGTPLHVHTREDELFLVEEGEISYYANGVWTAVGPGGAVYFPKGIPHRFHNNGTIPARHSILITPSGFEYFFVRLAEEVSRPDGPDSARIAALHAEFAMPLVEEQEAK